MIVDINSEDVLTAPARGQHVPDGGLTTPC
jgi:hypothetical protein